MVEGCALTRKYTFTYNSSCATRAQDQQQQRPVHLAACHMHAAPRHACCVHSLSPFVCAELSPTSAEIKI